MLLIGSNIPTALYDRCRETFGLSPVTGVGHGFTLAGSMRELNAAAFAHAPREQGAVIAASFNVGYIGVRGGRR